ncbi:MAG: recombinase family protein [Ruminococcus sp.]|nr:recombinase family protein [Ruminococcus sp.]
MEKAYAYIRYSSHNQDNGNSISAQKSAIQKFAKENQIKIVATYIDKAKTGTNTNRENYQKMLCDLEKYSDVKCIVVHVLDRLHRNVREQLNMIYELKGKKIRIRATNGIDTMNEDCMLDILDESCQAEKYSRRLSKETRKGLMVNAEQAIHNGGCVPYGFQLGEDRHLEIDAVKAPAVRKIFEMYAAGMSYKRIIRWLDENGYKTVNNRTFASSTIKSMLENEKYCGIYYWDKTSGKDYCGKRNSYKKKEKYIRKENGCPAIVSKELFEKVQERLRDNKNKIRNYNGKNYYPMNGKVFCKKCGKKLSGQVHSGKKPLKQYKFSCDCSPVKTINEKYLDDMVLYGLKECIFSPVNTEGLLEKLNGYAEEENKENQIQLDILESEKNELVKNQGNLLKVVEKGIASNAIMDRLHTLEVEMDEIDCKREKLVSARQVFTEETLSMVKDVFVEYVVEECNEDVIAVLNDTIDRIEISDTIDVKLKKNIPVDPETKKNFHSGESK